jgi:fructan beta-fructosidase
MFRLTVEKKYIWIPIKIGAKKETISIFQEDGVNKLFEFQIPVALENHHFYAALNVEDYVGSTLIISADVPQNWFELIQNQEERPQSNDPSRPKLHFSAEAGWINDPNGLIFHQGVYHLYYQYNPFDTQWGDMHWGHATSLDLLHWKQEDTALYPDENGTIFSGCAVGDNQNLLGFGVNTLLFYYTVAGGANAWSQGKAFQQRLALSTDGGKHLRKINSVILDTVEKENRDPKIFWHNETKAYIMVLFLIDNDFAIFRSSDLREWKMSQRLTLSGAWECPDLFALSVDDTQEKHWVFWSADGFYYIGNFDGYQFTPTSPRKEAYIGTLPYAAQTYSNVEGRVISVAWLRTLNKGKQYTGMMAIPVSLSLTKTQEGERLRLPAVEELTAMRTNHVHIASLAKGETLLTQTKNQPYELQIKLAGQESGVLLLEFAQSVLSIDFTCGICKFHETEFTFEIGRKLNIGIIVDFDVVEIRAQNDIIYLICENMVESLSGAILAKASVAPEECVIDIFNLK